MPALVASLRLRIRDWTRALPGMQRALDAARLAFRIHSDLPHARALNAAWLDVGAVLTALEAAPRYAAELRAAAELTGSEPEFDPR